MSLSDLLSMRRGVDLAKAVSVHPVTICAWKRGSSFPPLTRIPALAAALGLPEQELRELVERERAKRRELVATDPRPCPDSAAPDATGVEQ
jgi:transcriptional regulator with XRE-family HTH domain